MKYDELQRRVQELSAQIQDARLLATEDIDERLARILDGVVSLFWDQVTGGSPRPADYRQSASTSPPVEPGPTGQGGGARSLLLDNRRDAGLRQLERVVNRAGRTRARLRLDTEMLERIKRDQQTALLAVDNDESLGDDQIRTLISHLDHLGAGLRDLKADLNLVNWAPLLRPHANTPDSRGYCCESCECCVGTYQNYQDQWLCADCADCGSCPRQRMRRPLGEVIAGVIEPRVAQIRTQIELAASDAIRLDRAAAVPEGDTRGRS